MLDAPDAHAAPASAPPEDTLVGTTPEELAYLEWQLRWVEAARPDQIPPSTDWGECGYRAGRGYGKTRVGAEWIARETYEQGDGFDRFVICPTRSDVQFTAFEGESGILSVVPPELVVSYNRSDLFVVMKNCAGGTSTIRGFSAEQPERLRGPQSADIWADEVAAWARDRETWDMMTFCNRLGKHPRVLWTSTPKPKELIRELTEPKPGRVIITGSTYDNRDNLAPSFFDRLEQYEGTRIGRQELYGELIDPEEAGIVRRSWFNLWPAARPLPRFDWIIMSLDTAYTEKSIDTRTGDPDPTACSVWGVFHYAPKKGPAMAHVMLLDCWEDHLGLPDLMRRVKKEMGFAYGGDEDQAVVRPMFGASRPQGSGRKPDILLIEDKGSGISLRQMLAEARIEAYAYNPGRADKVSRLHIVSPVFSQRRVWLPESEKLPGKPRTWCEPLIAQLCSFTGSGSIRHDDFVDSTTQAIRLCMDKGLLDLVKPRAKEDRGERPPPKIVRNPYAQ